MQCLRTRWACPLLGGVAKVQLGLPAMGRVVPDIERVWGGCFEFGDSEVTEFTEAGWAWVGMIAQVSNVAQGCRSSKRHGLLVPDFTDVTYVY